MTRPLLLLLALGMLTSARADPRDDRRGPAPRDRGHGARVIVYQHAEYRGDSLVLYPGDSFEKLSDLRFADGARINDAISSIRIEGNAEIQVYADPRFSGNVMRLTENAPDLTKRLLPGEVSVSWNDRISSLRVEERRRSDDRRNPDDILRSAFRDVLGREPDLSGLGGLRSMIIDQGWTEEMIRDHLRQSDEFRNGGADRITRQAYQESLGREPTNDELAKYRRKILEQKWGARDVVEDLKRTAEYRDKNRHR